jgi:hypothetical protein
MLRSVAMSNLANALGFELVTAFHKADVHSEQFGARRCLMVIILRR